MLSFLSNPSHSSGTVLLMGLTGAAIQSFTGLLLSREEINLREHNFYCDSTLN